MKTKFTEGNWEYVVTKGNDIVVKISPNKVIKLGHISSDDCGNPICCKVEEHANAKLIAAVPELFWSLCSILDTLDGNVNPDYLPLYNEIQEAKKAIKKATE